MSSLHFCRVGTRAVFLDIRANRYFALPEKLNTSFVSAIGDCVMGTVSPDELAALKTGMSDLSGFKGTVSVQEFQAFATATSDHAPDSNSVPIPALLLMQVAIACFSAKLLVRLCPLHWLLARIGQNHPHKPKPPSTQIQDHLAGAFRRVQLLMGKDGNCLPHTLAFVWLSRRLGYTPRLVIGVRINPFGAHCWCQDGPVVLNDHFENVRTYQPILIL
ncbi:Transglutaminase-like superfamily protein [Novosphingobium mathurense]|uniref:Transglutaminase-like superfamily protein n=1 Tax=Novosphingobium mathurense TaxID=428990 RepID=A0A1U6IUZ3_9SPHN|nr:Transglutaminase-like superfamily protein [Novosphingobium mathurense]